MNHLNPGVALAEALRDHSSVIHGSIINDDDFQMSVGLRGYGMQGLL